MKRLIIVMVMIFTLIAVGCSKEGSSDSNKGGSDEAVKIGWFGPLTGPTSTDGQISLNAVKLAVEQINEKGGINGEDVELISIDDQGKPQEAAKGVQKLISSDGVAAIVSGAYSGPTLAAASTVQNEEIPMIVSYAKHPDATKGGDFVSRMIYTSDVQAKALAEYAIEDQGLKEFALLYMDIDYGQESEESLEKYISELDGNISIAKQFSLGDSDFSSELSLIKEEDPDALLVVAYYNEGAAIVNQAKQMGIDAEFIGIDGLDAPKFIELAGDSSEGTIISTSFYKDDDRDVVQDFVSAYSENYDTELSITASQSYDAVLVIQDAIERSSTDGVELAKAISDTEDFEGTSGEITIDENNEVVKPIIFMEVKDGNFEYIKSVIYE